MTILSTSATAPSSGLSTEVQLLLGSLADGASPDLDELRDFDPAVLANALECHRLGGIFYTRIKSSPFFSETVKRQCKEIALANGVRLLGLSSELCRIVKLFQENGIRSIALKGPALGMRYFGDYTLRECNDLDILVEPERVNQALALLLGKGYQLTEVLWSSPKQESVYRQTFHHYNLYHSDKDIVVELHWRLYSSVSIDRKMCYDWWDNLEICCLGGVEVSVLSSHELFVYLCLHGGSHRWRRLFWVLDIAAIVQEEEEDFLREAYRRALARGVGRYVLLGCCLANRFFGAPLPLEINEAIKKDKKIGQLAGIALAAIKQTGQPATNPLTSRKGFVLGVKNLKNHYRSVYLLGGLESFIASLKKFFINPAYWRRHAFSDRYFAFNYVAAPFFWAYSLAKKGKE